MKPWPHPLTGTGNVSRRRKLHTLLHPRTTAGSYHPARQPLRNEIMAGAGADQIEVQGLDQAVADGEEANGRMVRGDGGSRPGWGDS